MSPKSATLQSTIAAFRCSTKGSPGFNRVASSSVDGTPCRESDSGRRPPRLRHNVRRGISCARCGLGICIEKRGLPHLCQPLLWSGTAILMPIIVFAVTWDWPRLLGWSRYTDFVAFVKNIIAGVVGRVRLSCAHLARTFLRPCVEDMKCD